MAFQSKVDFDFKGQVPIASIVQAFQNKALQSAQLQQRQQQLDQQQKQQALQQTMSLVTMGGKIAQTMVETSRRRQLATNREKFLEIFASTDDVLPFKFETLQQGVLGPPKPTEFGRQGDQPGFNTKLQTAGLKAKIPGFEQAAAKQAFGTDSTATELRGRDIQQFNLVAPDGNRELYSFIETANEGRGALVNALSGEPMTPERRKELARKGYKLSRATPNIQKDAAGNLFAFDPVLGKRIFNVKTGATTIPPDKIGTVTTLNDPLVPRDVRKDIIKDIQGIKRDPVVKSALKTFIMLENVERFLKDDNKVAIDRLGGLTQKLIALDSGNLAAWEQRDPGSRELTVKLRQWAQMWTNGTLVDVNKKDMVAVLRTTRENLALNVEDSAGITIDGLVELYPQFDKKALWRMAGLKKFLERLRGNINFDDLTNVSDEDLDTRIKDLRSGKQ